jgi:ABC-type branched-subunit amino acid transport system ATPase component
MLFARETCSVMGTGRIVMADTAANLRNDEGVKRAYLGV